MLLSMKTFKADEVVAGQDRNRPNTTRGDKRTFLNNYLGKIVCEQGSCSIKRNFEPRHRN